jgi:hypothetical protein
MFRLKTSFLTFLFTGVMGALLKILHYEILFYLAVVINLTAAVFTVYFIYKKAFLKDG